MTGNDTGPWLLAIDSSTEQAGVALFDGLRGAETTWDAGRAQTVSLLGQIHRLLELLGLTVKDVAAIAVATGPGTFNGLRVGMSVAKGLVLGLDIPLLGVPTLDAAALPYTAIGRPVIAVAAAGRGRLVWAEYIATQSQPAAPRNGTIAELVARANQSPAGTILTGELTPDQETALASSPQIIVPPRALRIRRPSAIAELAWPRFLSGEVDDPITLEPLYLHGPTSSPPGVAVRADEC